MPLPADYRELSSKRVDPRRVEALWSFHASSPGTHLVLPDGRMDLVVRYRINARGGVDGVELAIVGPSRCVSHVPVEAGDRFLGLRFHAGWGGACLGVDARSLRDDALVGDAAAAALGTHAALLGRAVTPDKLRDALVIVGHRLALSTGRGICPRMQRAVDLLHLSGGRLDVAELSRAVGAPERTLCRRTSEAVGLSCKALAAVLRFQRTIRLLDGAGHSHLTLAQAALEGGYSDQAHMTREFRRHGGFTPGGRPPVAFGSLPIGGLAETFNMEDRLSR